MGGSTAVAVETDNYWKTTPALVRIQEKRKLFNIERKCDFSDET